MGGLSILWGDLITPYKPWVATSKFGLLTVKQHSATRKHLFPYSQGDTGQVQSVKPENQKMISINTNLTVTTSVHVPKPVSTDLTVSTGVRF